MNFQTIATTLAAHTDLTASQVVQVARLLGVDESVTDLRTHEQRVRFARTVWDVNFYVAQFKKVHAIKALREASKGPGFVHDNPQGIMGLKDAKDAVEGLWS